MLLSLKLSEGVKAHGNKMIWMQKYSVPVWFFDASGCTCAPMAFVVVMRIDERPST